MSLLSEISCSNTGTEINNRRLTFGVGVGSWSKLRSEVDELAG
jgi:hypothetical protein